MSAYFQPLYVKEDLLDVVDARECSAEDLVSVGVDAEDARALAFCGGAPPKWCAKQSSPDRIVTRARSAIARAREAAASNASNGCGTSRAVPRTADAANRFHPWTDSNDDEPSNE